MLYEPLPGSAAFILAQLGIIETGQAEALGARTYDAESGRLSLSLDDGRTVELERAMHLQSEDGYAVRIRSRAGQTISRSFIHIDRDLGVRNLHNDRMVYIHDAPGDPEDDLVPDEEMAANLSSHLSSHPGHDADESGSPILPESEPTLETSGEVPEPESLETAAEETIEAASETSVEPTGEVMQDPSIAEPLQASLDQPEPGAIYFREVRPEEPVSEAAETVALNEETPAPEAGSSIEPETDLQTTPDFHWTSSAVEEAVPVMEPEPVDSEPAKLEPAELVSVEPEPVVATLESETMHFDRESPSVEAAAMEEISPIAEIEPFEPAEFSLEDASPVFEPEIVEPALIEPETIEPEIVEPLAEIAAAPEAAILEEPAASLEEPLETAATEPELAAGEAHEEPAQTEALEPDPHYAPLLAALAPQDAADFDWIAQTGTIQTYEHRQTFRYIHIDGPSGLFYDQTRTPISRAAALKHALQPIPVLQPVSEPEANHEPKPPLLADPESPVTAHAPHLHAEPELRTRSSANGSARAAIKPEPDPATQASKSGQELGLDAFTRRHNAELERDSWRNRIADLSRALRLSRNPNSRNDT